MQLQKVFWPVILATLLLYLAPSTECANVLAVVPFGGKSHFVVIGPMLKGLAKKGHNVTVVSAFPLVKPIPNYTDIDVSHVIPGLAGSFTLDYAREYFSTLAQVLGVIKGIGDDQCEKMYKDEKFHNLLNSTDKYDLLITEIFSTDCFLPFSHKFNIPAVSVVTSVALPWTNDRIANPDNPSYIANYFSSYGDRMNFLERLSNAVGVIRSKLYYYYNIDKPHYETVKKYFGNDLPSIEELARQRTSLILANSYFSVNQPRPLVPNFVEVGGIHLQQPEPLPIETKNMLDNANNGFILFSLGSLFRASSMDQRKIDAFLKAFSKLPQLVLWKFEEELPNCPPNVITRKWWPQKDILVHENMKVFITHGGLSSTLEVVNAGVPMLGIPIFADQAGNVNNIVRRGAGIQMNYEDISYETLLDALSRLTNDKSYMENAKKISRQFKDRPLKPLDNAIFWIEYVLRHKGAQHMRSAAVDLPMYQYSLIDVIGFMLFVLLAVMFFIYKVTRKLFCILLQTNKINVNYTENKKNK